MLEIFAQECRSIYIYIYMHFFYFFQYLLVMNNIYMCFEGLLRCGKSCRLRWINYLRADLRRGNITPDEEETIVKLHTALGNRYVIIYARMSFTLITLSNLPFFFFEN